MVDMVQVSILISLQQIKSCPILRVSLIGMVLILLTFTPIGSYRYVFTTLHRIHYRGVFETISNVYLGIVACTCNPATLGAEF